MRACAGPMQGDGSYEIIDDFIIDDWLREKVHPKSAALLPPPLGHTPASDLVPRQILAYPPAFPGIRCTGEQHSNLQ